LSIKHLALSRPSWKLTPLNAGPFIILERHGNVFLLDLPSYLKIYLVINTRSLYKDLGDPLPGQVVSLQESIIIDREEE